MEFLNLGGSGFLTIPNFENNKTLTFSFYWF